MHKLPTTAFLKKILLVCLLAYGVQVGFTLFYTHPVHITTQNGVSIYNKRDCNPFDWSCNPLKYIPALGLAELFARHDNTLVIRYGDDAVVELTYEAWDESGIDFGSFQVEPAGDGSVSVFYDNTDKKKEFLLKLQHKRPMDY